MKQNKHLSLISLTSVLLFVIVVNTTTARAEESRSMQIIKLVNSNENKETKLEDQTDEYIEMLRLKFPNWPEEKYKKMREAFEDITLEDSITAPKIEGSTAEKTIDDDLELKPSDQANSPKKIKLPAAIAAKVNLKDDEEAILLKELEGEAERTMIALIVKRGDTLSAIAKRNYGDPNMYLVIYEENKDQLPSPDLIPEGITLRVPKVDPTMGDKYKEKLQETRDASSN
ncbi:MAG: LysM peptidoglycan-binding domain-containing protein [bacterium]